MIPVFKLSPECQPGHVGLIPSFLEEADPRPARAQFHERYGAGWSPMPGFKRDGYTLFYPGDPPLRPLAVIIFRAEEIYIYHYGFVAIFQKDGSFECARMD